MKPNMRKEWFCYVSKTRKKMQRGRKGKDPISHRAAMKEACKSWPKEKAKILNRLKREERKRAKEIAAKPVPKNDTEKTVPAKE